MMQWRKDPNMKYVDLCIYVDEHAPEILTPGEHPEVENLIYNYIWLLVKALAIKKRMFDNFNDYDGYALYSANRLYFALRKSYANAGKIIKGKEIKPIKSILNYTKALLYPMKLEYLNEQYALNIKAKTADKQFDEFAYKQQFKDIAWYQQGKYDEFKAEIVELFSNFNYLLDKVLKKSPFQANSLEYKKLRISILLNCLQNVKNKKGIGADPVTVICWKLPKSMGNYIRVFIKELGADLKQEIMSSYSGSQIEDRILTYMLTNPEGEFVDHEE